MYGISRIDDASHRAHAWRVSLSRRGQRFVKNFTDKKHGGKAKALGLAQAYRDELLIEHPPLSRKEFVTTKRSNNKTGIAGVCTYAKSFQLRDGTIRENWYWEANWPTERGENMRETFSVKRHGEEMARQLAIRARDRGVLALTGSFWASERGEVELSDQNMASDVATTTNHRSQGRAA